MEFEIPLKLGTALTSTIPDSVSQWTSEDLIAWLKSFRVRGIDDYAAEIANTRNGYDGTWILRRKDDAAKLRNLFTVQADVDDIMDELKSWINQHPQ